MNRKTINSISLFINSAIIIPTVLITIGFIIFNPKTNNRVSTNINNLAQAIKGNYKDKNSYVENE